MIEVPVLDAEGKEQEKMQIDEALLGGCVHRRLLRDVVVMYEANRRQGTAKAKSRGETAYGKRPSDRLGLFKEEKPLRAWWLIRQVKGAVG